VIPTWQDLQNASYGPHFDYEPGSPHLVYAKLRNRIAAQIREAVQRSYSRRGDCHVLEIGAGHGSFTEVAAATGASVTVTEMSASSAAVLTRRFEHNARVHVMLDSDGSAEAASGTQYDIVLCISVLHHIPDYLGHIANLLSLIAPGGDFISYQDPLLYERRTRHSRAASWAAYFAWRVWQGNLKRGLRTRIRHLRGVLDETLEEDMVEYHCVRGGVDEEAMRYLLIPAFESVTLETYWSTQSASLHRLGEILGLRSTFGFIAKSRHAS
jgi:SAM-dependent methyltransferase